MVVIEVGKSVAKALQAAEPVSTGTSTTAPRAVKGTDRKGMYNNYNIAILKGFFGATLLSGPKMWKPIVITSAK